MQIYAAHGVTDFVIACGYKAEMIKEYFHNFVIRNSDFEVDLRDGKTRWLGNGKALDWRVSVVDTGFATMTGGRLLRLREVIGDERFMLTYGDGVGNVDITALAAAHASSGRLATVTAVHPPSRFGALLVDESGAVTSFSEKSQAAGDWINGGFFVFEPQVLDYMDEGDATVLERRPLEHLAQDGQLHAFRHAGFWQCMDTLREKRLLEDLWERGEAPWKVW
jgi:glucose-1-phosphate cytidylyltransferase